MTRRQTSPPPRPGFTLVEILVAAALTVLTMAILATAFQVGVNTLSHLRTIGSLSEQLRNAEAVMRGDLGGPGVRHLEDQDGNAVRVSDNRLATAGWSSQPGTSANSGYFRVVQYPTSNDGLTTTPPNDPTTAASSLDFPGTGVEGSEESVDSFRSADCSLSFTTKVPAASATEGFVTDISAMPQTGPDATPFNQLRGQSLPDTLSTTSFASPWAEIGYVLQRSSSVPFTIPDTTGSVVQQPLRLYSLYRRQRLLVPNLNGGPVVLRDDTYNPLGGEPFAIAQAFPELSISPAPKNLVTATTGTGKYATVNTPATATRLENRLERSNWGGYNSGGAVTAGGSFYGTANPAPATLAPYTSMSPLGYVYPGGPANVTQAFSLATPPSSSLYGTDLVLSNVLSMQILVMTNNSNGQFVPLPGHTPSLGSLATGWQMDTNSPASISSPRSVLRALQIKLRIYDIKNRVTRQISITQDL